MLNVKLQDKIPCLEIRKRTKIIDIIEYILKRNWRWVAHIARMKDQTLHRGPTKEREEIKGTTKQKTTWQGRRDHPEHENNRQKTLVEGYILQWMDKAKVKGERVKLLGF